MTTLLNNIAVSGYRSFGAKTQYFEAFSKINIFIGRNNSGKSNVLRLLKEVLPAASGGGELSLDHQAVHLPDAPALQVGVGEAIDSPRFTRISAGQYQWQTAGYISEIVKRKAEHDETSFIWSMTTFPYRDFRNDTWKQAFSGINGGNIQRLWTMLTGHENGNREQHWEPDLIQRLALKVPQHQVELIPAIRRIGESGLGPASFDGTGLIDRLAKLQNPDAASQSEKQKFESVNTFLREVSDRPDARIEIPYARDTILVHMDDRVLPIECLGSGLHEVLILAAAATVISNQIVCIEEPELHLNPILQKKLVRHLLTRTSNQYFMTSHSAALMDTPGAEVYHITLTPEGSLAERVTSDAGRLAVCEDLGYHPSDLLLANCIVWVEGPSDRLYVNWWRNAVASKLIEGIHFSIMFYGGRLAAHVSNAETDSSIGDFIMLRRLNSRGVIIIDSDKAKARQHINETKRRLIGEFNNSPGFAWVTEGREVENYLTPEQIVSAIKETIPSARHTGGLGRFDNTLEIRRASGGETQASKVAVARYITESFEPDLDVLDLRKSLSRLVAFIRDSNPNASDLD